MKILIIGNANSVHIVNLANRLCAIGHDIVLFTVDKPSVDLSLKVKIHVSNFSGKKAYILSFYQLRFIIQTSTPDLINIHYASGYGLLSNFINKTIPILMSVWGSDVYIFPKKNIFNELILRRNLKNAKAIASTSHCMAKVASVYVSNTPIYITPFGIDVDIFSPNEKTLRAQKEPYRIVTVKGIDPIYGTDRLIRAFHYLIKNHSQDLNVVLEIYGDGAHVNTYRALSSELNIENYVVFYGKVDHKLVPSILNSADIFVALSRSESYGVSVLEASSCALPVVVSQADGLKEVVINGVTGFVVDGDDYQSIANKLHELLSDSFLRNKLGSAGREMVLSKYNSLKCIKNFSDVYSQLLAEMRCP